MISPLESFVKSRARGGWRLTSCPECSGLVEWHKNCILYGELEAIFEHMVRFGGFENSNSHSGAVQLVVPRTWRFSNPILGLAVIMGCGLALESFIPSRIMRIDTDFILAVFASVKEPQAVINTLEDVLLAVLTRNASALYKIPLSPWTIWDLSFPRAIPWFKSI